MTYLQPITPRQEKLVYEALLAHDGRTLAPGWKSDRQAALTGALDHLRQALMPSDTGGAVQPLASAAMVRLQEE